MRAVTPRELRHRSPSAQVLREPGAWCAPAMPGEYLLVYTRRVRATRKQAADTTAKLRRAQGGRIVIATVSAAKFLARR